MHLTKRTRRRLFSVHLASGLSSPRDKGLKNLHVVTLCVCRSSVRARGLEELGGEAQCRGQGVRLELAEAAQRPTRARLLARLLARRLVCARAKRYFARSCVHSLTRLPCRRGCVGGKWNPNTGYRTAGGSSIVAGSAGGAAMSTRPRYYMGSSFSARPILFVGVASYFWYRGSARRDCTEEFPDEQRFQYGNRCRKCSDWACPIGQYRERCTPQSDSYCKTCTNKPDGDNVYTTPGNQNDCEWAVCTKDAAVYQLEGTPLCEGVFSSDFESAEFAADSTAELVFYSEIPVDKDTFNSVGGTYKEAVSELAGGASVNVGQVETVSATTFTRMVIRERERAGQRYLLLRS